MKECEIISNIKNKNRLFKRIHKMSCKWRSLNRIVINLQKYIKFHMNYVHIAFMKSLIMD